MLKSVVSIYFLCFFVSLAKAQQKEPLPNISVKNIGNKIIISWQNNYTKPIANLNIQRSYDSLKNYSTIGSVLSPQSVDNGYADNNPPYIRMYYRVFVAFEGGSYIITTAQKATRDTSTNIDVSSYAWLNNVNSNTLNTDPFPSKPGVAPSSTTIYTAKDNNVVIHLPFATLKKYRAKFYDDANNFLFEVNKLQEDFLIIEKVNFIHTGWFKFELYEGDNLIETNKFQIIKDVKKL